jgi:hypothetical protein
VGAQVRRSPSLARVTRRRHARRRFDNWTRASPTRAPAVAAPVALTRVQAGHPTWTRAELRPQIRTSLPADQLGTESAAAVRLLNELTARALAEEFEPGSASRLRRSWPCPMSCADRWTAGPSTPGRLPSGAPPGSAGTRGTHGREGRVLRRRPGHLHCPRWGGGRLRILGRSRRSSSTAGRSPARRIHRMS